MQRASCSGRAFAVLPVWVALAAGTGFSQAEPPEYETLAYRFDSGEVSNTSEVPEILFTEAITVEDAGWIRLHFESVELSGEVPEGTGSILRLTSAYDAAVQEQNAHHVRQWQSTSCYFNGDTVLVEVLAQPGTGVNRVVLREVTAGFPPLGGKSICDADDRVFSNEPRTGRSWPQSCTAWLIDDCAGCLLTAGHCATGGSNVIQFNVPPSLPDGTPQHPGPEDQYAVDPSSNQGSDNGPGNDFRYLGTFPNSNTGMPARQAQGAYQLMQPPAFDPADEIRVTGYGTDAGTANYAQQTDIGPWTSASGPTVRYRVDTTAGNSGSAVLHVPTGFAIGIHTHGGCGAGGTGSNLGTGVDQAGLQNALQNPLGVCIGASILVVGELPDELVPGQPTVLTVEIANAVPGTPTLSYRYDGGSYIQQPLVDLGNNMHQGTLPPATCLDFAEYFFSTDTSDCGSATLPADAPNTVFEAPIPGELAFYCTAKTGLLCGPATVAIEGVPSATNAAPFRVTAFPTSENRPGVLVYSDAGPTAIPFQGGLLCVNPQPLRRSVPITSTNVGFCLDALSIDMNAFAVGDLGGHPAAFLTLPGAIVNAQWWGRDSVATGSLLTNAVEYRICE